MAHQVTQTGIAGCKVTNNFVNYQKLKLLFFVMKSLQSLIASLCCNRTP